MGDDESLGSQPAGRRRTHPFESVRVVALLVVGTGIVVAVRRYRCVVVVVGTVVVVVGVVAPVLRAVVAARPALDEEAVPRNCAGWRHTRRPGRLSCHCPNRSNRRRTSPHTATTLRLTKATRQRSAASALPSWRTTAKGREEGGVQPFELVRVHSSEPLTFEL